MCFARDFYSLVKSHVISGKCDPCVSHSFGLKSSSWGASAGRGAPRATWADAMAGQPPGGVALVRAGASAQDARWFGGRDRDLSSCAPTGLVVRGHHCGRRGSKGQTWGSWWGWPGGAEEGQ